MSDLEQRGSYTVYQNGKVIAAGSGAYADMQKQAQLYIDHYKDDKSVIVSVRKAVQRNAFEKD